MTGWIKTSERLPEIKKFVLLLDDDRSVYMGRLTENQTWWVDSLGNEDSDVEPLAFSTHWHELPPLPEN